MDSHLERRNARSRHRRHLFVAHPLDVLQDERLALFGRQRGQRTLHQGHLLTAFERRPSIRAVRKRRRVAERDVVRVPPREMAAATIPGNPVQPAAQALGIAVLCQMPVGAHETLSYRVGRGVGIPEHTRREAKQARLVSPDENPKRLPIAAQHPGDYLNIGGPVVHHLSDPLAGGYVTVFQGFPALRPETSLPGHRRRTWRRRTSPAWPGRAAGMTGRPSPAPGEQGATRPSHWDPGVRRRRRAWSGRRAWAMTWEGE